MVHNSMYQIPANGITGCQLCGAKLDTARFRRPGSVRQALVPSAFGQVSSPGYVRESTRAGTCPLGTSDSPTTLTCMRICIRAWPASAGCPSTGFFPPTCSRRERVASTTALGSLGRRLLAWLPMPLAIERAMHIHAPFCWPPYGYVLHKQGGHFLHTCWHTYCIYC